jgi:deoxyribose-phosphate aldolase
MGLMSSSVTVAEIAATIDHAILKPELTRAEVDEQLALVARYGVFSACVRPSDVAHAYEALEGSGVAVCAVIGFPHGTTSTRTKVAEAVEALDNGASELDMVLNIGRLRSGLVDDVEDDIRAVVTAAGEHVVKVILETAYLDDDQIVAACEASERAGAAFVKTSTGFAGGGATVEHLRLMRASVSDAVQVKASGGARVPPRPSSTTSRRVSPALPVPARPTRRRTDGDHEVDRDLSTVAEP